MRDKDQVGEAFGRHRPQHSRRQRLGIGGMIGVKPGPFYSRGVGQPRHRAGMFVCLDEFRKVATIFEQQWRCRRRGADMESRHGAEKLDAGDTLGGGKDRRKRVDEADGDVVTINIITLDDGFAGRTGHDRGRLAAGIDQRADANAAA